MKKIKAELAGMGEMRSGSLTRKYKDPETGSGPCYQLSYTRDMKSRTAYSRREWVSDIRRQIRNYKRFKKLSGEWIALSNDSPVYPSSGCCWIDAVLPEFQWVVLVENRLPLQVPPTLAPTPAQSRCQPVQVPGLFRINLPWFRGSDKMTRAWTTHNQWH